ncbi:Synaptonemal complex protein 2 [Platanthera zijinensis]|uniref:Synaptonemal complex protein 2 n=1 Tax=Platanthera zijinensis TaxID=2320716 RepID=A0AAP0G0P6_9ASPA
MQKLGISSLQSFDKLRSLRRSEAGTEKTPQSAMARSSLDSVSHGSLTNLKLTAEKLVKEQTSAKADLEFANAKLRKATEQIHMLEAKLQDAINENTMVKVKQVEDAKLWNELDTKFNSAKTLYDQLCEAVQKVADQNDSAEEDKKLIEERLSKNTKALDNFKLQFKELSTKLECAENKITVGKQEICKLIEEKEAAEKCFKDELFAADEVMVMKDATIKDLEDVVEQSKQHKQTLDSQLQVLQHELISKEELFKKLNLTKDEVESEKKMLLCNNLALKQQLENSCLEIKNLEAFINNLMTKISQLDKDSLTLSNNIVKLISSFDKYYDLIHQEKDLASKNNQEKIDKLQQQLLNAMTEINSFNLNNEQLNNRIIELQRAQEFVMVQHADECRLAEDKVRKLESEVDGLLLRKNEAEKMATELEGKVVHLSEVSIVAENKMQDLLHTISKLELENEDIRCRMQLELKEKFEETEALRDEIKKYDKHANSLGNQIEELRGSLDEKEKFITNFEDRAKQLEEQKSEVQTSLIAAECKLTEAKKQYDMMLEGKQLELSKHLKELSQKNDQAINEIRKKYEAEKEEISSEEKEKSNKLIREIKRICEEKIEKNREEAERCLMQVEEEHKAMIFKMKQDCDQKEVNLHAHHREELQLIQLHAENELREKASSLRKEHEIQMKSLKMQYDDEHKRLQEDLEMQKSKEKQRKLLQLQWKVMSENQQDNQEVNSKKEYSTSSIKKSSYRHEIVLPTPESERKEMKLSGYMQTPMANLLKKANDKKTVPKHRKVTRHEYEVETSNGQTFMKRRKTQSTMILGDPSSHNTMNMRTPNSNKDITKKTKITSGPQSHPANIGDLFSEGSLNPYTDDPYAFG